MEAILAACRRTNLLHPAWELPRLTDALRSTDGDKLVRHLARFALGDWSRLPVIARIGHKYAAAKWPIVTYPPFLWDSGNRHVILRHEPTTRFAARVGHPFPQVYESGLNPAVYRSLLDLFATTTDEIAELNPRDAIDVQSFVWVVSKYGE